MVIQVVIQGKFFCIFFFFLVWFGFCWACLLRLIFFLNGKKREEINERKQKKTKKTKNKPKKTKEERGFFDKGGRL